MNEKQRRLLLVIAGVVGIMILFPPYVDNYVGRWGDSHTLYAYEFLFRTHTTKMYFPMLFSQIVGVFVVGGILWFALSSKKDGIHECWQKRAVLFVTAWKDEWMNIYQRAVLFVTAAVIGALIIWPPYRDIYASNGRHLGTEINTPGLLGKIVGVLVVGGILWFALSRRKD